MQTQQVGALSDRSCEGLGFGVWSSDQLRRVWVKKWFELSDGSMGKCVQQMCHHGKLVKALQPLGFETTLLGIRFEF